GGFVLLLELVDLLVVGVGQPDAREGHPGRRGHGGRQRSDQENGGGELAGEACGAAQSSVSVGRRGTRSLSAAHRAPGAPFDAFSSSRHAAVTALRRPLPFAAFSAITPATQREAGGL